LDVDTTALAGIWWRQIPAGADVHYRPPDPPDFRWQRGSVVEAVYFADSQQTVWAEWYRYLAEVRLPPRQALPRDLWRWEISLPEVADLSDDARLARAELPPLEPTRLQWPTFHPVGEQLHKKGWPALVSSSAARPEGRVLCVFRTARVVPGTEPIPPPTRVDEPPALPTGMRT
jgi:hypothetical protein